ncbi:hypothetical protein [Nocardia sp. NPDC051570]|uniref:hypothetical protein n=1 Tax=Nocardia sp. NPDC051570 TaxID=3364324 RepID=UPI0037ABD320
MMWKWSRTVAERAAAATWNGWQHRELAPTVLDPESWREPAKDDPREDVLFVVRTLSLVR